MYDTGINMKKQDFDVFICNEKENLAELLK